jgi:hypothetical protein
VTSRSLIVSSESRQLPDVREAERRGMDKPLSPTLFLFKLSIAALNTESSPPSSPVTLYWSNWTGTLTCSKISLTESVISGPTPSPGMRVT